ncbi:MAG: LuxR C-terminal-related transcriptional regulator [Anaerolineales bacterium]
MLEGLLKTKLFPPPPRSNLVNRQDLLAKFALARQRGVACTLVSAPAGFGKTTLVVDYARSSSLPFAWFALDEDDNDLLRFWRYIDAALATIDSRIGEGMRPALYESQTPAIQQIVTSLVNDILGIEKELILVIDDYHMITNPAIHEGMTFLINHLPHFLHLIIATRADPPLPISRLRAQGQLMELRVADLRFNTDEASAFLNNSMNLDLLASDVEALETRTEGWIVGLQLAALSMQERVDKHQFIQSFTGSHHYVLEYLMDEVLSRQPVSLQRFLLETSILPRMCAPLCDAVTERADSGDVLSDLNRRNLFVTPLDGEHYWFRYHHLFAELLNGNLHRTRADDLPLLHRRAAQWFHENNYVADALRHAFAIPDYPYASRLVVDNWRYIYHQGRLNTAVEWLDSLPPDFVRQSPPLGVAYCWTLFVRGDYDRIEAYLDEITQTFEQMVDSGTLPKEHPEYNIVLQQVILLRAIVMRHHGDVAAALIEIEQLLPTIEGLRQTLGQIVADMGYTACYSQMGYTYVAAGDLSRAADCLSRVSPHARRCGNILALAHTTIELARISLLLGRLEQAEKICRDEISLTEQPAYANYPAFCLIHLGLADVLRAKKFWNEAEEHLTKGLETAQKSGHMFYLAQGYLIAARLHHAQGKAIQAQDDLRCAEQIAGAIHNRFLNEALSHTRREMEFKSVYSQPLIEPLSDRELEVLNLICAGKSNQEIADELFIALDTVKRHANNLYGKLGVKRRAQAIIEARRLGLV